MPGRGGVGFAGNQALLYRANLWLRTAIRVLKPILEATVTSPEELYDAVRTIDWSQFMTPDHTLAVDCNVRDSQITHSKYAALKTKDAICDQFVERCGRRPSVNVEEPMVGLNLHIYRDEAVLSLESSGESLHKRGYRPVLTKAPLNEALAAALVLLSGWGGATPFVDPLCGSGVLPIEASWLALRRLAGFRLHGQPGARRRARHGTRGAGAAVQRQDPVPAVALRRVNEPKASATGTAADAFGSFNRPQLALIHGPGGGVSFRE